jgi:hypothetical protein
VKEVIGVLKGEKGYLQYNSLPSIYTISGKPKNPFRENPDQAPQL